MINSFLNLFPPRLNYFLGPCVVILLCVLAWLLEPRSSQLLALQRESINVGAYWQFITANFVHTNSIHLLLNISGVTLLWLVHGQYFNLLKYLLACFFLGITVTIGLYFLVPELTWYGGLSGVLHGLFVIGAGKDIKHQAPMAWMLMVGIWLKILYEQVSGQSEWIAGLIQANVAVDAHLYGAIGGIIWLVMINLINQEKTSPA